MDMNSSTKKPTLCRYFVSNGSCFYGSECQFLHANPPNNTTSAPETRTVSVDDGLESLESHNDRLDSLFIAFSQQNGLPQESKLTAYMNRPRNMDKTVPNPNPTPIYTAANTSVTTTLASSFASLNLESGSNPAANEFIPRCSTPANTLTHTSTSPPYLSYNQMINMTSTNASNVIGSTPFGRLSSQGGPSFSSNTSPLQSPRLTPQQSPLLNRKTRSPNLAPFATGGAASSATDAFNSAIPTYQENFGGTTYYYTHDDVNLTTTNSKGGIVLPNFHMFPGTPAHVAHMNPKANAPSFFMPDDLRIDVLHRHNLLMAQVDPEQFPGVRLTNTKCMALVDMWKKLQHSNIVQLREVFTTKAFGEHSVVFVHDYHPAAETMMARHFTGGNQASGCVGAQNSQSVTSLESSAPFGQGKAGVRQNAGLLPESLIWCYVVQLSSALRTIHAAGLACRALDPTKILIVGKSRLRLNCCGIFDVLCFDPNQSNMLAFMPHYQVIMQEDLVALGKIVLALACNSLSGIQRENVPTSMDLVTHNYSADLRNLILYLLTNQTRFRSVNDIMPMIGARFYTQLDAAQMRSDVIETELSKEVENGRLFRLLTKLGIINERPEFSLDPTWSETGDRYMLKLFRDYLFHQVTEDGRPWVDMAHIVQCLNKLDAGVNEKIVLMSRDEQNVLVVTYSELKHCFETSYAEVVQTSQNNKPA
uniref:PAN2-PAN3 deadenylation complex subunit PAN3 n=1 Tax=Strigamia maritima TaxID=126957 RepID=T1JCH4_STRMM